MSDPKTLPEYQAMAVKIRSGKSFAQWLEDVPESMREAVRAHRRTYVRILRRAADNG